MSVPTAPSPGPKLAHVSSFGTGPTNSEFALLPSHSPGDGVCKYDFPEVSIGTAEYAEGPTGATVIWLPAGARTAVDRRGGAVGLIGGYAYNHAICFAGGSVYGLAAATGVSASLLEKNDGRAGFDQLQLVSGAIIYDFSTRDNAIAPDAELGRAALAAAVTGEAPIGRCGAGAAASAGKVDYSRTEYTGQGVAFSQVGAIKMLAVTVPNPIGVIMNRQGEVVRGNYDSELGARRHPSVDFRTALANGAAPTAAAGNTTITAVITNVAMSDLELGQFAKQVHSSMHRAIQPFHTMMDGDVLFAMTTDQVTLGEPGSSPVGRLAVNPTAVGTLASDVVWDAVLASVAAA